VKSDWRWGKNVPVKDSWFGDQALLPANRSSEDEAAESGEANAEEDQSAGFRDADAGSTGNGGVTLDSTEPSASRL
jgi:hypothetical protein